MNSRIVTRPLMRAALLEQFRIAGLRLRIPLAIYASLLALFAVVVLAGTSPGSLRMRPNEFTTVLLVLLLLPFIAWGDSTQSRAYLLATPLRRRSSLSTRIAGGWAWGMIALTGLLATMALLALLTGGEIGASQPGLSYPSGGYARFVEVSEAVRARFGTVQHEVRTWQWLTPFAASSVLCLILAAVTLGTDQGGPWLVVLLFAPALLRGAADASGGFLARWATAIGDGRYGLDTLMTGNTRSNLEVLDLPGGDALVRSVQPGLAAWPGAVGLWGVIGVALLSFLVYRHRDR